MHQSYRGSSDSFCCLCLLVALTYIIVYLLLFQIVITPGVTGAVDCLMHLICDPGGGCGLFVYLFCCVLHRHSQLQNNLLGHHRPRNCSTFHFIAARCVQIVVNVAHCSSEGYTPVGDSAILADVICPAWPGTLPLFHRVKHTTHTVLTQQGRASLCSSK